MNRFVEDELSEFEEMWTLQGHEAPVVALAVAPDGSRAVTASADGDCRAWDLQTGRQIGQLEQKLSGEEFCLAISPDGRYGLVGGEFEEVHVWEIETGEITFTHSAPEAHVAHVAVSGDGRWMVAFDADGRMFRFPPLGGHGIATMPLAPQTGFDYLAVSERGDYVILGNQHMPPILIRFPEQGGPFSSFNIGWEWEPPTSASVSGNYIGLGTSHRSVVFRQRLTELSFEPTPSPSRMPVVRDVAVSQDGKLVLALDETGRVDLWPMDVPTAVLEFSIPVQDVSVAAAGPDGLSVSYGHKDGTVSHWRLPEAPRPAKATFVRAIHEHFQRGEYDELESLANRLELDGDPFPWYPPLDKYAVLVNNLGHFHRSEEEREKFVERLQEWITQRPDSPLPRLVLTDELIRRAWAARGGGYADTVREEGWRIFGNNIEAAWETLEPIREKEDLPGAYYHQAFIIAMAQSWERERIGELVQELMEHKPLYGPAHTQVAELLLPRWGGQQGESERYIRNRANRIGGDEGLAVYSEVARRLLSRFPAAEFFERTGFDYELIQKGFAHRVEQSSGPIRTHLINESVYFAAIFGDKETAQRGISELEREDAWSLDTWLSAEWYQRVKQWAMEDR